MLFYYDLLDFIIGVLCSLFGIVNSILPFCILLCIYTFYCVLYSAIPTWRFRLLWWCFALSIWQCKVLYPIVQFYILLCRSSKIGLLSEFWYSVLRSRQYDSFHLVKLYYALVISCMALREQKLDDRAGEWVSFSCSHAAIFCHPLSKWRTMLIRRIDKKTSIDQVLKLLREAKKFLSGSLRDNIPLANSTSIHNPNRSERIASNLRALFSTYDDSPVSSRRCSTK